jgi:hypothetical protein
MVTMERAPGFKPGALLISSSDKDDRRWYLMYLGWASPVGLGILLAGVGVFFWGLQFLMKDKKE